MIGSKAAFVLRRFYCHKRVDAVVIERNESFLLDCHDGGGAVSAIRAVVSDYLFLVLLYFHECSAGHCILRLRTRYQHHCYCHHAHEKHEFAIREVVALLTHEGFLFEVLKMTVMLSLLFFFKTENGLCLRSLLRLLLARTALVRGGFFKFSLALPANLSRSA